jgi:hypothetical protein
MECRSVSISTSRPSPIHLHQRYRYAVLYILYVQTLTDSSSLGSYHSTILIAEATVPAIYQQSFGAVDPTNSGETSVNSLSRVLSTSSLPAAKVDKVRHTPTHPTPSHPPTAHSHSHGSRSPSVFLLPPTPSYDRSICGSFSLVSRFQDR